MKTKKKPVAFARYRATAHSVKMYVFVRETPNYYVTTNGQRKPKEGFGFAYYATEAEAQQGRVGLAQQASAELRTEAYDLQLRAAAPYMLRLLRDALDDTSEWRGDAMQLVNRLDGVK